MIAKTTQSCKLLLTDYKNKNLLVSVKSNGTPDEVYQNILNAIK